MEGTYNGRALKDGADDPDQTGEDDGFFPPYTVGEGRDEQCAHERSYEQHFNVGSSVEIRNAIPAGIDATIAP